MALAKKIASLGNPLDAFIYFGIESMANKATFWVFIELP